MMDEVLKKEEAAASREDRSAEPVRMVFEMDRSLDRRRYNAPTCNEMAVVYVGEFGDVPAHREFAANADCEATVNSAAIPAGFIDIHRYLYTELPTYFTFKQDGTWTARRRGGSQLGPAATALGLFDEEPHIATLREAALFATALQMRALFVSVLAFMKVKDPALLWNTFKRNFIDDYLHEGMSEEEAIAAAYYDLEEGNIKSNINIASFNIPTPSLSRRPTTHAYDTAFCSTEGNRLYGTLNSQQKAALDTILGALDVSDAPKLFFIDGPSGSGKTWTYTYLFNILIGQGRKVACTAWTGIAANLLPSGCTTVSLFKLNILNNCEASSHRRQMKDARLLGENNVFIWDEASMISKTAFERVDAVLRETCTWTSPLAEKWSFSEATSGRTYRLFAADREQTN
ncbi:unnamed protein product [Cylicocyclus nassatus]|uniref:ATP-dependent DNA helicase n=1 Tax=Cylicocyclus nassatus TaxID=53992 RepID=A0AA36GK29_CYLNA|nr:unnamed protein product [Cylicocyclus nassatus]